MTPLKSTRIAWSVAVAALALWATSVPVSWGQAAAGAINITQQSDVTVNTSTDDNTPAQAAPCPPSIAQVVATLTIPPVPAAPTGGDAGAFHLCGADAQAERDIEQLIAGRSFSSTLSARGDGCAELTIRATSGASNGSVTSNLSVSLGSGRTLSIKIASQGGATHVSIGSSQ